MKTIEQYEKEKQELADAQKRGRNGIQCPNCEKEMIDSSPGLLLLTSPAKKHISCTDCGYKTIVTA